MGYKRLTKQARGGGGRKAITPPSEDISYLRFARSPEDKENDQTSMWLFNIGDLEGLDLEHDFPRGFHVQIFHDFEAGMVAVVPRPDLDFEVRKSVQVTDEDGNLVWKDSDGTIPKMTAESVVSKGKDVYNARRASSDSLYHSISSGGDQIATKFDIPRGEQIWLELELNSDLEIFGYPFFEGNLREEIERID